MKNHAIAALEFDASTRQKAQQHTFEFSIEAPGMVRVTNTEHDDEDPEDHSYLVNVEDGVPVACECPADMYHAGACKHRVSVAIRTPVLAAAIVRDLEDDAQEAEARTDGGQLVAVEAEDDPDPVADDHDADSGSEIGIHDVIQSHAGEAIRDSLYGELPGFDEYCALDWAVCETAAHVANGGGR